MTVSIPKLDWEWFHVAKEPAFRPVRATASPVPQRMRASRQDGGFGTKGLYCRIVERRCNSRIPLFPASSFPITNPDALIPKPDNCRVPKPEYTSCMGYARECWVHRSTWKVGVGPQPFNVHKHLRSQTFDIEQPPSSIPNEYAELVWLTAAAL